MERHFDCSSDSSLHVFIIESVILTRILDVNDVSEPQCYSVSEASTDTLQPTVSNYETVTEHRETHGNSTSEYEGVVSHALAIQQPVALNHPHYALMATEVAEGLVYSIVPPQVSLCTDWATCMLLL